MRKILLACVCAISLTGCTTIASGIASIATNLSSSTPSQVSTLADAEQAATLATQATDTYVKLGVVDRATLLELQSLNNGLHTALTQLEAANTAKQSLVYASFNAALAAFNSYTTSEGIAH